MKSSMAMCQHRHKIFNPPLVVAHLVFMPKIHVFVMKLPFVLPSILGNKSYCLEIGKRNVSIFSILSHTLIIYLIYGKLVRSRIRRIMGPSFEVYRVLLLVVVAAIVRDALHLPVDRRGQRRALAPVE